MKKAGISGLLEDGKLECYQRRQGNEGGNSGGGDYVLHSLVSLQQSVKSF